MGLLANNTAGLLGGVQQEMTSACPDVISIQRAVVGIDSMGGSVYDWTNPAIVAENVPANIQSANPRESEQFARRGIEVSHKVFVPQSIDAKLGDRIPNPNVEDQYLIITFISDMGGMHSAFKIYAKLVS